MHDCPQCQVPLHGHESFCPVCGLKQIVRPENRTTFAEQYKRASNPLWLVLLALVVGALLYYAVQNSWVGALIKRGPAPVEETLTPQAARTKIESMIMQNLAQQSVSGKFTYTAGDKTVDLNYPQSVNLTIDVNLKHSEQRKSIVEPVKDLMAPANINTIILNDEHSHGTVTLTLPPEPGQSNRGDGSTQPDNGDQSQQ
jgi:hypothetical protein